MKKEVYNQIRDAMESAASTVSSSSSSGSKGRRTVTPKAKTPEEIKAQQDKAEVGKKLSLASALVSRVAKELKQDAIELLFDKLRKRSWGDAAVPVIQNKIDELRHAGAKLHELWADANLQLRGGALEKINVQKIDQARDELSKKFVEFDAADLKDLKGM